MSSDFGLTPPGGSLIDDPALLTQTGDSCFGCSRPQAHVRACNAVACPDCRTEARLVRGGAFVEELLAGSGHWIDQGAIQCLLNPVEIRGRRGFLAFGGGLWRINQEQHHSADFFDFPMLHFAPQRATGKAMRTVELASAIETRGYDAVLGELSFEASIKLQELVSWWDSVRAGKAASEGHPMVTSPADVETMYESFLGSIRKAPFTPAQLATQMLERVASLQMQLQRR